MNKLRLRFGLLLCLVLCLVAPRAFALRADFDPKPRLHTVLTYNVRNTFTDEGKMDPDDVAATIRRCGADVVALQELDSVTGRCGGLYVLGELAERTGMYPTYAPAISYDGGKYGIGILSRRRPVGVRRIALPGREEARALVVAEFPDYVFACTPLSLPAADRRASLPLLAAEAARYDKPFILAGDFNDTPGSPFIRELGKHFSVQPSGEAPTHPAAKPDVHIDYITAYNPTGRALLWTKPEVVKHTAASDHCPLMNRFYLRTPLDEMFFSTPYLQNPAPDGMTVMYQTRTLVHSWVEYGTDTLQLQREQELCGGQAVCHDIEHRVRLGDLQPGTRYYYRVCVRELFHYAAYSKTIGDTLRTPFHTFTTPDDKNGDFTALIFNDMHQTDRTMRDMARLAATVPHDFVVFNGDCLAEPTDRQDAIRMIRNLTERFNTAEIPAFFVRGNHEIRNAYSAGMPSLLEQPGGRTYGAFNWGDTRFVILDCGEDKPDDHPVYYGMNDFTKFRLQQRDFLARELKSREFRKAKRRVLIHHIPLWGNTDKYRPCTELWAPLCGKGTFDVAIGAHTHEFRYHAPGTEGNAFPVFVGGGPSTKTATMMVLSKKGKRLTLRVISGEGRELGTREL